MQLIPLIGTHRPAPATQLAGLALSMLGIALATLAGQTIAIHWGSEAVVLLYLLPVLGAAVAGGPWLSLAVAVAATLAYNFYFTEPVHTLFVRSPASVVTVLVLLAVGLVTSALAGSLREQALLAASHASRNATIAGYARRLLSCGNERDIYEVTVEEVARLFDCRAVLVTGRDAPQLVASAPAEDDLSPADAATAAQAMATGSPAGRGIDRAANLADWQFHPLPIDGGEGAALGLAREDGAPPVRDEGRLLVANLLDQTALALARARADYEARELATLRERDGMRDALLASVGRDLKPSVNAIAAAARAMRRSGEGERALVAEVLSEAGQLGRYVDNLADVVPGSIEEPLAVGTIEIDLYRRTVSKAGTPVRLTPKEYAVLAELAKHAGRVLTHAQLLRAVWGPAQQDQVEYLRVAIGALRRKLENDPAAPALIVNEPAVGYRLALG